MEDQQINNNQEEEENFVFEDQDQGANSLNLKFTLGFSSDKVGAVHNLTLDERKVYNLIKKGNFFSFSSYWGNLQL